MIALHNRGGRVLLLSNGGKLLVTGAFDLNSSVLISIDIQDFFKCIN